MLNQPFESRRTLLRRAATLCAVLVLVVTSLSAFLRQSSAALGCTPWPACHSRAAQADTLRASASPAEQRVRALHRVLASALLVLLLALTALAVLRKPRMATEGRALLLALGLALFLAVLGVFTAKARVPAVTLGNLLGGMLLFSACVHLAVAPAVMAEAVRRKLRAWAWLAAGLLVLQAALGALVSAGYAGLSCAELHHCVPGVDAWAALNPWRAPGVGAGEAGYAQGVGVHLLHRATTLPVLAALVMLSWTAWRGAQRTGAVVLLGLAALQVALGVTLVLEQLPMAVALVHNVLAALLLGTVAGLGARAAPEAGRVFGGGMR